MHLYVVLLTALLTVLLQSEDAHSLPTRRAGKFVSISITKVPPSHNKRNLPPAIVHQQHANRGIKRMALMTGRSADVSTSDLISNLQKRAATIPPSLQKRYYHVGFSDILGGLNDMLGGSQEKAKSDGHAFQTSNGDTPAATSTASSSGDNLTKANPPIFNNSVGLDIEAKDEGYIGDIQIGTPPRTFRLLMDSGSADFWVGAEGCHGPAGSSCGPHNFLGPKSSSTFNDTKRAWSIRYGTGDVQGHVVRDNIRIAGLSLKTLEFGVALNESEEFTPANIPFDGLAGFAKSEISQQHTITIVEALHEEGLIDQPITSYKIPRLDDHKNDGEMTLGALDPSKYRQDTLIKVPNVNMFGFWEGAIGAVNVNGHDMGWSNRTAILDTGTTLIIAPKEDVDAIHRLIPGAVFDNQAWNIPCNSTVAISLAFGGRAFAIDSRDMTFLPVDPNEPNGLCISGIASGNFGLPTQWLVGDTFLKNAYFSTNVATNEISLAKLA